MERDIVQNGVNDLIETQCKNGFTIINPDKLKKFKAVYDYFYGLLDRNYGSFDKVELSPDNTHGVIIADLIDVELRGEDLKGFIECIDYIDEIKFVNNSEYDTVRMEVRVFDVWKVVS